MSIPNERQRCGTATSDTQLRNGGEPVNHRKTSTTEGLVAVVHYRLVRALPLMRYKAGQHDLICDATGTGKDYLDEGCTAYEAVCVLMSKLDAAKHYIAQQHGQEAQMLMLFLNAHQDSEDFCCLPLYGPDSEAARNITPFRSIS